MPSDGEGQSVYELLVPDWILRIVSHDFLLYLTACLGIFMPTAIYFLYHYLHKIYAERQEVCLLLAINFIGVDTLLFVKIQF